MPMVVMKDGVKESSEKRRRRQLLPTPVDKRVWRRDGRTGITNQEEFDEIVVSSRFRGCHYESKMSAGDKIRLLFAFVHRLKYAMMDLNTTF